MACGRGPTNAVSAAPGEPLPGLGEEDLGRFLLGRAVFERLAVPEEGLGPLFNAERCSACHNVPASGGSGTLLVTRATRFSAGRCDVLENEGGDNIQQHATPLLSARGIASEHVPADASGVAHIVAPPLFGLGLIAAIPDAEIAARADSADADGDGISGRVGRTPNGRSGRFSRKEDVASIPDFIDTALRFEIGLTTPTHPVEEKPNGVPLPTGVDPMPEPEIEQRGIDLLRDYVRFLAPPPREPLSGAAADSTARGAQLFQRIGCASCHTPALRTAKSERAVFDRRSVPLYSDLLLHDMGTAMGDICGHNAAPAEWRTSPLWGLRFRTLLLHNGRATTPRAAILAHDGEAQRARDAFTQLDAASQTLLLRFLASL